jgi:hypothetical protein
LLLLLMGMLLLLQQLVFLLVGLLPSLLMPCAAVGICSMLRLLCHP